MKLSLLALVVLVGSRPSVAQVEKPRIGVTNFEAPESDANLARQASEALCAALVRTGAFEVLDQSSMVQKFLEDVAAGYVERRAFIETLRGERCTETQCLGEIGDALEARFMVAGRVAQRGPTIWMSTRLVDVYSRSTLYQTAENYEQGTTHLLRTVIPQIADQMRVSLPGEVILSCLPNDASVMIDEKPTPWRSDRALPVPIGEHTLHAARRGFYDGSAVVHVEYGPRIPVDLCMERKSAAAAMFRSLLIPGLGEFYSDRPSRGALYLLTELAVAGGAGYAFYANMQANDDYDAAKEEYLALGGSNATQPMFDEARAKMERARDDARSTQRVHIAALIALGALHVANVLDAGIGFPDLSKVRIVERPEGVSMIQIQIELAGRDRR